jgi:branched-chain amino acid transport system permease protein
MVSAFIAVTAFTILAAADVTSIPLALTFVLIVSIFFTSAYGWAVERTA